MKFMNVIAKFASKQEMLDFRNKMLDEADALVKEGKTEEANAKMQDVKVFDEEYEAYAEQQANIEALRGAVKIGSALSDDAKSAIVSKIDFNQADEVDKEYRKAFMNFVLNGEKIPAEFKNTDAYTTTSDVTAVIPQTVLNRIIEKMEQAGNILNKVTRTFYKGGVTVPTSSAKPVATWTTERGKVDKQKKEVTGDITFNYYKLKCVVAISLTVEVVTMDVFERTLASNIAEAMVKALEAAIVSGDGSGKPKGIITETPLSGQKVEIAAANDITYEDLCAMEASIPSGYEAGAEWCMNKRTYFNAVVAMTDSNGQPIARVNMGIDGKPYYTILGRPVNFTDQMPAYSKTVSADTDVAFIFRFTDYMLNTNMNITTKQYEDNDTDDKMTKAIMLVDGKVIDKNSLVKMIKKKA